MGRKKAVASGGGATGKKTRKDALNNITGELPETTLVQLSKKDIEQQQEYAEEFIRRLVKEEKMSDLVVWAENWSFPLVIFFTWARLLKASDLGNAAYAQQNNPQRYIKTEEAQTATRKINLVYSNMNLAAQYTDFMLQWSKIFRWFVASFFLLVTSVCLTAAKQGGFFYETNDSYALVVDYWYVFILFVMTVISVAPFSRNS